MKPTYRNVKNTIQRKKSNSPSTEARNIIASQVIPKLVSLSQMSGAFPSMPLLFETAVLLRRAQLEAQIILQHPLATLCLLQALATYQTHFLPMSSAHGIAVSSVPLHRKPTTLLDCHPPAPGTEKNSVGHEESHSSYPVNPSRDSLSPYGKGCDQKHRERHHLRRGSDYFLKRLRPEAAGVYKSRSPLPPHSSRCKRRSTESDVWTNSHQPSSSSSLRSGTSEITATINNHELRMTKKNLQSVGAVRVSGIPRYYSESDLIKMATPFGQPLEIIMATEVDVATCAEWKKALIILPTEISAQEMVKVYSAIPVHMRQLSLELVYQPIDLSSSVSLFHSLVGPSTSNGLFVPSGHLLVVPNVPNHTSAPSGVLHLLKPFGKVFRMLHYNRNKVGSVKKSCIQMILEMESASVASSVSEWSQKVPCLYRKCHLSFLRASDYGLNCV